MYIHIYNTSDLIFPSESTTEHGILTTEKIPTKFIDDLYMCLLSLYVPDVFVNESYYFHLFHGILFSYDIKDIYGFLSSYKSKALPDNQHKLTTINKINFFEMLQTVVEQIKQTYTSLLPTFISTTRPIPLTTRTDTKIYVELFNYVTLIEQININGTHKYDKKTNETNDTNETNEIKRSTPSLLIRTRITPLNFDTIQYRPNSADVLDQYSIYNNRNKKTT